MPNPLTKMTTLRLARQIQGWCPDEALDWLYDRASSLPAGSTCVEVGVWKGKSLCPMALAAKKGVRIIAVDTFNGNPESLTHFEASYLTFGEWSWVRRHVEILGELVQHVTGNRLEIVQLDSILAATCGDIGEVDLLHLDPDYRANAYAHCRRDIQFWLPKLRVGGWVCGSSYAGTEYTGVMQAVNEMIPERILVNASIHSFWIWRKP